MSKKFKDRLATLVGILFLVGMFYVACNGLVPEHHNSKKGKILVRYYPLNRCSVDEYIIDDYRLDGRNGDILTFNYEGRKYTLVGDFTIVER